MGREKKKGSGERWVGIPHWVMQSAAYRALPHPARSLLFDIVMQYNARNNGTLVVCDKYLRPLGWASRDVIVRAKDALLACGLLVETRKGQRPNKAAWYALGWRQLDAVDGLDINPRTYRTISQREINAPCPPGGLGAAGIRPRGGQGEAPSSPSGGPMRGVFEGAPCPSPGHCIPKPYPVTESAASRVAMAAVEAAP